MTQVFGSVVIDVVIAMALVFFVFSLVTSGLNEVVVWLTSTRSKVLWQSVRELLDDPISHGLQPLYEAIEKQEETAAKQYLQSVATAARELWRSRDEARTSQDWTEAVETAMGKLRTELDKAPADVAKALAAAEQRLKDAYVEPTRLSAFIDMFWHKGAEGRPSSPVVPTVGSVSAIARNVHIGIRSFTDAVYDHPLIRQLDKTIAGRKSQLTWLSSDDFSGAALDLIQAAGVERAIEDRWEEAVVGLVGAVDARSDNIVAALKSSLSELEDRIVAGTATAGAIEKTIGEHSAALIAAADAKVRRDAVENALAGLQTRLLDIEPLELIERGLEALENIGPVRDTVTRAVVAARSAGTDAIEQLSEVSERVGAWYDTRMESLTVWYRRRSRFVGFVLAFLVVVGFNIDAIDLPRELWRNESIRSALVAVAETSELDLAECVEKSGGDDEDQAKKVTECVDNVEAVVDELIDTGLPVGWVAANGCNGGCTVPLEALWYSAGADDSLWSGPLKIIGWMLAAAALSMGASFWFDVMRRAMGIKAAVKGDKEDT